mmetsp:Transcript_2377/g.3975  ORF Transcript_2377/g.3975 Transcript_2377/m.3975 type:complete len:125 (-) Transcript_2377:424-798(-)|eukprot:CAMPEP_0119108572 /NCGR_PEP_ID=MMETSP1180-20130426/15160_1 /TAXON_ID=3052 ORGANISM="Chlamydomonas cf sp, Strain CCMP681" /NCGR_SAMPLE_ID=MMETSP1180 /ASSEMBLY_ACC=CAM_ASM_000741 /LENGTH=124 /DNA_ID=CAMNT_0007094197 /DNA_START=53 /DNA_END=427 /DNA_ORIENTATION=-
MAAETKAQMERELDAYKKIQADMTKLIGSRTQLESQHTENSGVLEELNRLDEDANVFKLIGPALIKQDLVEAKANVSKRIEYIKGEMDRADGQIKSFESKIKDREQDLFKLQKRLTSLQPAAAS